MAPDHRKDDLYTITGASTSTTYNTTDTICSKNSRVAYSYTYTQPPSTFYDDIKFLKKLERIKKIARMMMGWVEEKPEIKKMILRPAIQLRGVSFGGRGWA